VAASLRLRLWELTRLNREGALPLPPRWPPRLAALFWPLVLILGFAGVALLGWTLLARTPATVPPTERPGRPTETPSAAPAPASAPAAQGEDAAQATAPEPAAALTTAPSSEPLAPEPTIRESAEEPHEPDPLLRQLGREGVADPLLARVDPVPAAGLLRLRLAAGFDRLSRQERLARAEQWQERAGQLGFERLELQDERGRPLGRNALVGSGMILLDPDPPG
jgi:hypothetical protein